MYIIVDLKLETGLQNMQSTCFTVKMIKNKKESIETGFPNMFSMNQEETFQKAYLIDYILDIKNIDDI